MLLWAVRMGWAAKCEKMQMAPLGQAFVTHVSPIARTAKRFWMYEPTSQQERMWEQTFLKTTLADDEQDVDSTKENVKKKGR